MANPVGQYSPVSTRETSTDDALSVRAYRDMAAALNNAHYHACCHKVRASICFPGWDSLDNVTSAHVVAVFAGVDIPDGFTHVLYTLGARRMSGAGDTQWRLYLSAKRYQSHLNLLNVDDGWDGNKGLYTAPLSVDYQWGSVTVNTNTNIIQHGTVAIPSSLLLGGRLYMLLVAVNTDSSTYSRVTTLDVKPIRQ